MSLRHMHLPPIIVLVCLSYSCFEVSLMKNVLPLYPPKSECTAKPVDGRFLTFVECGRFEALLGFLKRSVGFWFIQPLNFLIGNSIVFS